MLCNLDFIAGKIIPATELPEINKKLSRIGFPNLSSELMEPYSDSSYRLWPTLNFESNVNGGNPTGDLQVGSLLLKSDPNFSQKQAVTIGAGTSLIARHVFAKGFYSGLNLSHSAHYSISSPDNIQQTNAEFCTSKQIQGWDFFDICIDSVSTQKTLSSNSVKNNWIQFASYYTGKENSIVSSKVKLGTENGLYLYDKIKYSYGRTFREGSGSLMEFGLKSSNSNTGLHGYDFNFQSDFLVRKKQYSVNFRYINNYLGPLLGVERKDQTIIGTLSLPLHNKSVLSIGYGTSSSTIDYYDNEYLILNVSFR